MKNFYLGIDAGGTSYNLIAVSINGKILFKRREGAIQLNIAGLENFSRHISNSIKSALSKRNYKLTNCIGIVIGVAGARHQKDKDKLARIISRKLKFSKIIIESDTEIARFGAFGGDDGMLMICGTGSILYGKMKDKIFRLGGWGRILGDEGSGYKIGLEALEILTKEFDLNIYNSNLAKAVKNRFKITNENLIQKVYIQNFSIQKLAPLIIELAKEGDGNFMKILNNASADLSGLIKSYQKISGLKKSDLILSGSLVEKNKFFCSILKKEISRNFGNRINIIKKKHSSEFGAYLIAKNKFK